MILFLSDFQLKMVGYVCGLVAFLCPLFSVLYENGKCNGISKFDLPNFQSESEEGLHLQKTPANEFGVLV